MRKWQKMTKRELKTFAFLGDRTAVGVQFDKKWFPGLILKFYDVKIAPRSNQKDSKRAPKS